LVGFWKGVGCREAKGNPLPKLEKNEYRTGINGKERKKNRDFDD
jgi:hypothetical protein